ncbi:protein of unknown function DUF23 [Nannochloropsis gaditana]|uniref:Glycosyltransferase family 92 protein n=1 Tax=Nannochloropsis gaditana TaxID=72520 RepID=W7TBF1_9STRA|nr:protein of unknown function DUF23 [Nannochloropsis gaditana]
MAKTSLPFQQPTCCNFYRRIAALSFASLGLTLVSLCLSPRFDVTSFELIALNLTEEAPSSNASNLVTITTITNSSSISPTDTTAPALHASLAPMIMPAWTDNHRFYVLGGILTRDQIDERLYMDVMVAGRRMFLQVTDSYGVRDLDEDWSLGKSHNVADPDEVVALGGKVLCHVSGEGNDVEEEAVLVPTRSPLSPLASGLVHIIRCPVADAFPLDAGDVDVTVRVVFGGNQTQDSIKYGWEWPRSNGTDAGRGQGKGGEERFRVVVPRATRHAGYFSYLPEASELDPWQAQPDKLHLCVAGLYTNFTCPLLDQTLEFVEYHTQQGVAHIHLGVDYPVGSESWKAVLRVLRPYIDERKVSVMSTQSVRGPGWIGTDQFRLYFYASCLAYTKGLATWVGIWDNDEYLVPRDEGASTIVQSLDTVLREADKTAKDVCFMSFTSFGFMEVKKLRTIGNRTWAGQMFGHWRQAKSDDNWTKSILSNRNAYFTGAHYPGACRDVGDRRWGDKRKDIWRINASVLAMHHYRGKVSSVKKPKSNVAEDDEYGMRLFPAVLDGLRSRKADEIVERECGFRPSMAVEYVEGPEEQGRVAVVGVPRKRNE